MKLTMKLLSHGSVHLLTSIILLAACTEESKDARRAGGAEARSGTPMATSAPGTPSPYDLSRPDLAIALPSDLEEISGLTALPDGRLAAIQDEDGMIFVLNPGTGAVESRESFGEPADYEGIEWVDDRLFVLRSNGRLFELQGWPERSPSVEVHRTPLRGRNDAEGLAYDADGRRLLIACKEQPGAGLDDDVKAIYGFDLATRTLSEQPVFTIDLVALQKDFGVERTFKPSALAIHPDSGHLYVLSATANALVVMDEAGDVVQVWPLSRDRFEQPEGIAFLPDGTLFMSSEGVQGPPMLYRFGYQPL